MLPRLQGHKRKKRVRTETQTHWQRHFLSCSSQLKTFFLSLAHWPSWPCWPCWPCKDQNKSVLQLNVRAQGKPFKSILRSLVPDWASLFVEVFDQQGKGSHPKEVWKIKYYFQMTEGSRFSGFSKSLLTEIWPWVWWCISDTEVRCM